MRAFFAYILYYANWFEIKRRKNNKNVILSIYGHNPKRESLDNSLGWLVKNGYQFISPHQLEEYINGKPIDSKLAFLSFDDGWKSNYYELLPVLEKYEIPATIFVATKGVEDGYYWIDHLRENRNSEHYNAIDEMWKMANRKRIDIIKQLPPYKGDRVSLTTEELRKLSESPYIYIGNHTHDHVICDTCTKDELISELHLCESKIKEYTDKEVNKIFAFPNGDYNNETIETIKGLDYKMGFTTHLGFIDNNTNAYNIPRNVLPDNASLKESILNMYNLWSPFFNRIKKIIGKQNRK